MHMVFDEVQACVSIPMINLIDSVAKSILDKNINTVGLLGTKFTMELPFYGEFLDRKGITVLIPEAEEREFVNKTIYEELIIGNFFPETRNGYKKIIANLMERGAGGVILGCTEIPLLISQEYVDVPLFDTTAIHAQATLDAALKFSE
jgi:aspartate racemase